MKIIEGGNIFESECIALVNPVNCVGVCGSGLALEFKHRFPKNYQYYKNECKFGRLRPGTMFLTGLHLFPEGDESDTHIIINFPTKDHWKNPSKLEYIKEGLLDLSNYVFFKGTASIAFPLLGCGLGGLKRKDVERLILGFDNYVNTKYATARYHVELYV